MTTTAEMLLDRVGGPVVNKHEYDNPTQFYEEYDRECMWTGDIEEWDMGIPNYTWPTMNIYDKHSGNLHPDLTENKRIICYEERMPGSCLFAVTDDIIEMQHPNEHGGDFVQRMVEKYLPDESRTDLS